MTSQELSRRHLVTTVAALPALAVPAVAVAAAEPDPIFAAIEEHRRAWWDDGGHCSDLDWIASHGETEAVREEAERKLDLLWEQVRAATDKLIDTAPTTNAGVAALLEYAIDHTVKNGTNCWPDNYRNGETWETTLHRSLARALRNIAVEA